MVYVRKRGNGYGFTVDAGKDEQGKRKQITRSGFKTENEAMLEALKIEEQVKKGIFSNAPELREFIPMFFEHVQHQVSAMTYHNQKHFAEKFIVPRIGHHRMDKITYLQIEEFYQSLLNQNISRGTIRNVSLVLRKAFKTAQKWGIIQSNIASHVRPPAYRPTKMKVWNEEQVKRFLEASKQSPYHVIYTLTLSTGMRIGEVLGLEWDDLDLHNGLLQVQRSLKYTVGVGLHTKEPKNLHSKRTISLPKGTIHALEEHKKNSLPAKWVFHHVGDPIYPSELSRRFQTDVKKSGILPIRFHDMRHTHATLLLSMGVNPKVVAERLGHSTVITTLDTYSHVMPSMQKEVAERLGNLF